MREEPTQHTWVEGVGIGPLMTSVIVYTDYDLTSYGDQTRLLELAHDLLFFLQLMQFSLDTYAHGTHQGFHVLFTAVCNTSGPFLRFKSVQRTRGRGGTGTREHPPTLRTSCPKFSNSSKRRTKAAPWNAFLDTFLYLFFAQPSQGPGTIPQPPPIRYITCCSVHAPSLHAKNYDKVFHDTSHAAEE